MNHSTSPKKAKIGLKLKIMTIFTIALVLSLLVLGAFTYYRTTKVLESNLMDSSQAINTQVKENIVTFFSNFENLTNFLASDANVAGHIKSPENVTWMLKLFTSIKASQPDVMNIY